MQFRFRTYNEEEKKYKLIGYTNIDDYNEMFQMLTFMKEHECEYAIEQLINDMVDTGGTLYEVEGISFVIPKIGGNTLPHIAVDVVEVY